MIGDTTLTTHRMKYSAAYSTGRKRMLRRENYCVTLTVSEGSDPLEMLEDLIANKKASGRAKDLADVEVLEGCRK